MTSPGTGRTSVSAAIRCFAGFIMMALAAACAAGPGKLASARTSVDLFPANGARNISPDTHLFLTFQEPPRIGTSGRIEIVDVETGAVVDMLDLSIPPSPRPGGRATESTEAERQALAKKTRMEDYQVNRIGGVDFHFFPVIVTERTVRITPHNNRLAYGRKYAVRMSPEVLQTTGNAFEGFPPGREWRFATKSAPPTPDTSRIVVAADGTGDFNTVQGAIDHAASRGGKPLEIFIRKGDYREIIFMSGLSNLTVTGEDRDLVRVGYANNSSFNPPRGGPSRRPAFSVYDSRDITLRNFTIENHFIGQAEALLARGERLVIDRMTLNGSGDALTTGGTIYMRDTRLTGDGDTILGYAALYCLRCDIHSRGPFTWTRTPEGSHGNVFVDSRFTWIDEPLPWSIKPDGSGGVRASGVLARLPRNGATSAFSNFPHAEMVLIDSQTSGVPPEGWGPIEPQPEFDWSNVKFMEFNTRDASGQPVDMSKRHPIVRVLKLPVDADLIDSYRDPAFVLGGWKPDIH